MFDQSYLGPARFEVLHLELVHERADQENAPTRGAHQIFRRQRIRQLLKTETRAFVGDSYREPPGTGSHRNPDLFLAAVPVAVHYGVDHRLANREPDLHELVFTDTGSLSCADRQFLRAVYALQ